MRESWTDDRLDDLNGKADALRQETRAEFRAVRGEIKEEFAAVRGEMHDGFAKIDKRFEKMDERFQAMDARLLGIYQTMGGFCGVAMATLIGFIATQI